CPDIVANQPSSGETMPRLPDSGFEQVAGSILFQPSRIGHGQYGDPDRDEGPLAHPTAPAFAFCLDPAGEWRAGAETPSVSACITNQRGYSLRSAVAASSRSSVFSNRP